MIKYMYKNGSKLIKLYRKQENNMNKTAVAHRDNWKNEPMPDQHDTFILYRSFDKQEMMALRRGNIPQSMEDKWFWYMEDDTLWASFNEARQQFYDKRKEFFKQRNEAFKESVAKKEALIEEAKKISDTADYGRENTDRMKQLDKEWTAAGYSGKTDNDRLWKEFNDAKAVFWNGKRDRAMKRISDSLESKITMILHTGLTSRMRRI